MTGTQPTSRHPSDAVLLRQLDGALGEQVTGRLTAHLERCQACRRRSAALRAQSAAAAEYLRSLPDGADTAAAARMRARTATRVAESRRARVGRQWRGWAAAAATAGLVMLSLGVDPLRAWVLARLGIGSAPTAAPAGARPVSLPPVIVGSDGSVVSFPTASSTFELVVQEAQPSGEIRVQVRAGDRVTAQMVGAGGESMLVLPSGLQIENSAASTASYRISVPASVRVIVVRIGGAPSQIVPVDATRGDWSVSLPLTADGATRR
jgi:anti-sigma factor RsiW